jgi:hypothetical protein
MTSQIESTNINDLPIIPMNASNQEEVIQNLNLSTQKHQLDNITDENTKRSDKRVAFDDPAMRKGDDESSDKKEETFSLRLEQKIIILATFFFFVFMDKNFKKYILNIFVQIFGTYLKSESNQMTTIGMFIYSLFYGSVLMAFVTFVDFTSFHLAF